MKILVIHNRYLIRGGEDESTDLEIELLRQHGHEVDLFEMDNQLIAFQSSFRTGLDAIWSSRAYRAVRERIRQNRYDLIQVQNSFPLFSPSIHYAAKAEGIPVVQALRNYRLFCLNVVFFRDGHICEDCMGKIIPWPGIVHRCYHQSLPGSMAVASMLTVHRVLKTWERKVDMFFTPSEFARRKFIQGGISAERIIVKPNFVQPDPGMGEHKGDFALFVGRLSSEKGIESLLAAWKTLPDIPLKIIGDGPMQEELSKLARQNQNIILPGRMSWEAVLDSMKNARFLVFPSEWYEGFPRVLVEAFACRLPVISTNIGSMAEIVTDGLTGLYFKAGDPASLAEKVKWAWEHPEAMAKMGHNARKEYELKYTPESNYRSLMEIYEAAMERVRRKRNDTKAN